MIYQLFSSTHKPDDPELRSVFVTTPLTLEELEPELLKVSPDGSLFRWAQTENKFDAYEEPNGVKMCYSCQDEGMSILAEYPDDVQLRDEVTTFFSSLSKAELELETIQAIPLHEAIVMTVSAVATCENFTDFIREKHRIERCHFVMR